MTANPIDTTPMDAAFEVYRRRTFGAYAAYPIEAYTNFCFGWKAAQEAMGATANRAAAVPSVEHLASIICDAYCDLDKFGNQCRAREAAVRILELLKPDATPAGAVVATGSGVTAGETAPKSPVNRPASDDDEPKVRHGRKPQLHWTRAPSGLSGYVATVDDGSAQVSSRSFGRATKVWEYAAFKRGALIDKGSAHSRRLAQLAAEDALTSGE